MASIEFEGGFAPPGNDIEVTGYEEHTVVRRYGIAEYIAKTKRSLAVFNTPAVHDCLGWKLGEFLALGKAIISTPLAREMPADLVHGKHVHFVDGSEESIREAISLIQINPDYRKNLEFNARQYYLEYLKPARVIDRLIDFASSRKSSSPIDPLCSA
jgi:glycosyltransferase involved in cell wall biosynthesis